MLIGINCFKDSELRSIIKSTGKIGHCDITCEENTYVYDTENGDRDDLKANLISLLELYATGPELEKRYGKEAVANADFALIEHHLESVWNIFRVDEKKIRKILLAVCSNEYTGDDPIFRERVDLRAWYDRNLRTDSCLTYMGTWDDFSESIKHKNRFHQDMQSGSVVNMKQALNLRILKTLFESDSLRMSFEHEKLYRARISPEGKFKPDQMGAPPNDKASAGRLNPEGISYLYLADSLDTVLAEVRARNHDVVSVGEFYPKKTLKLINFDRIVTISPFSNSNFELDWFAININILNQIAESIGKPMRRQDSALEYLPSQYIAEFIKSLGYDGICFKSTLHKSGENYVIFDEKNFSCRRVKLYRVTGLNYNTEPIDD